RGVGGATRPAARTVFTERSGPILSGSADSSRDVPRVEDPLSSERGTAGPGGAARQPRKPTRRWLLSQKGLFSLAPQRQSARRGLWASERPPGAVTDTRPRTKSGPFGRTSTTVASSGSSGGRSPLASYRRAPVGQARIVSATSAAGAPSRSTH